MNIKRFVKKERTLISMVAGVVILLIVTPLLQHGNAMYEDEFEICSFEKECFTLPADDIFDDETIEKIWMRFAYDLDTYPRD